MPDTNSNPFNFELLKDGVTPRYLAVLLTSMASAMTALADEEDADAAAQAEWEAEHADELAVMRERDEHVNKLLAAVNGLGQIRTLAITFRDEELLAQVEAAAKPLLAAGFAAWCETVDETFGGDIDGDGEPDQEAPEKPADIEEAEEWVFRSVSSSSAAEASEEASVGSRDAEVDAALDALEGEGKIPWPEPAEASEEEPPEEAAEEQPEKASEEQPSQEAEVEQPPEAAEETSQE